MVVFLIFLKTISSILFPFEIVITCCCRVCLQDDNLITLQLYLSFEFTLEEQTGWI